MLFIAVIGFAVGIIETHGSLGVAEGQRVPRGGCQFQIYLRPPIEFTGPAGGFDFRLSNATRDGAGIQVANAYGTDHCNWNASVNQDWVTLSQASGRLSAEDDTTVTVGVNENATRLSRGIHWAEITFTSPQDPQPSLRKKIKVKLQAQEPCELQVLGGTYRARALLGEVPGEVSRATLNNGGDAPCHWQAHSDVSWLTVAPTSGIVLPRSPQYINIRANDGAKNLVPDDYEAVILLQWRETRDEFLEIKANLEVDPPPCELHFEPGQTFTANGKAGSGEFTPVQEKFVLKNQGGVPCYYWQATGEPEWLEIGGEDETIGGQSQTDVVVSINQRAAAEVRPGNYAQTVRFASGVASPEHGLSVSLNVQALPCHLEIVEKELYFSIEPEGQLQSALGKPLILRNHWTNAECHWKTESRHDWLTTEPSQGVVSGGGEVTVMAELRRTGALSELDAGDHSEQLGFVVENGTAGDPVGRYSGNSLRSRRTMRLPAHHPYIYYCRPAGNYRSVAGQWMERPYHCPATGQCSLRVGVGRRRVRRKVWWRYMQGKLQDRKRRKRIHRV